MAELWKCSNGHAWESSAGNSVDDSAASPACPPSRVSTRPSVDLSQRASSPLAAANSASLRGPAVRVGHCSAIQHPKGPPMASTKKVRVAIVGAAKARRHPTIVLSFASTAEFFTNG